MTQPSHSIMLYGLSTCIHCRNAIEFLERNNLAFEHVYVDKLDGDERSRMLATVKKYNPRISFPTIVVDNGNRVSVGFRPEELREMLEL